MLHSSVTAGFVANVFIHREPVDAATVECSLEEEVSDSEESDIKQRIIYKIGKL